jgi:hypothetical protein
VNVKVRFLHRLIVAGSFAIVNARRRITSKNIVCWVLHVFYETRLLRLDGQRSRRSIVAPVSEAKIVSVIEEMLGLWLVITALEYGRVEYLFHLDARFKDRLPDFYVAKATLSIVNGQPMNT